MEETKGKQINQNNIGSEPSLDFNDIPPPAAAPHLSRLGCMPRGGWWAGFKRILCLCVHCNA